MKKKRIAWNGVLLPVYCVLVIDHETLQPKKLFWPVTTRDVFWQCCSAHSLRVANGFQEDGSVLVEPVDRNATSYRFQRVQRGLLFCMNVWGWGEIDILSTSGVLYQHFPFVFW